MSIRNWNLTVTACALGLLVSACSSPNLQPVGLTPIPTLSPGATPTLVAALEAAVAPVSAAGGKADPARGAPIYLENCSPCHGVTGQGVSAPALRNSQYIQTGDDQSIVATIANGRPGTNMPAWLQSNGGPLTDAQIADVVAYLHTQVGVPPLPTSTPLPEQPTETPLPPGAPTSEPVRPSNPGNPGPAVSLAGDANRGRSLFGQYCAACHGPEGVQGVPNPGSDDGVVPVLNPIDPSLTSADPKLYATNIDLFIEHGSVPSGDSPLIMMPSFGEGKMLTDQQMADLIAYVIQLNGK
jgi:mono/diheme cytochrome c family protein